MFGFFETAMSCKNFSNAAARSFSDSFSAKGFDAHKTDTMVLVSVFVSVLALSLIDIIRVIDAISIILLAVIISGNKEKA